MATQPRSAGIGAVERETGLSKETLRIRERRYGFPKPQRTSEGTRNYSEECIAKLRLVKRLLDRGLRAGEIVPKSFEQLEALDRSSTAVAARKSIIHNGSRPSFCAQDIDRFRVWLHERARALSIESCILDVVRPLCAKIGIAWQSYEIGVFKEHLLSEQIAETLRDRIAEFNGTGRYPRVMLTTLPGEPHAFGLLMLHGLLAAQGISFRLAWETPMADIVKCFEPEQINVSIVVQHPFSGSPIEVGLAENPRVVAASSRHIGRRRRRRRPHRAEASRRHTNV
jgi:hypothetical protein